MMKLFSVSESIVLTLLLLLRCILFSKGNHIKGLDDSILFRINWPGQDETLLESPDYEKLEMTTVNNEKFQCLVPLSYGDLSGNEDKYRGPSALELLMPLFKKKICSLRLEAFWTYELCHGQWMKQYHEVREENGQRYQDYLLGRTSIEELEERGTARELDTSLGANPRPDNIPHTNLEGVSVPYFAVTYGDGSICDLTGQPRVTRVLYVCYEEGRHAIFSVKETFTCEYEVVVLSSFLCQHPDYRPQEVPQTNLHCIPVQSLNEGRKRPKDLLHIEAESLKLRTHGTLLGNDISGGSVRLEVVEEEEAGENAWRSSTISQDAARSSPLSPTPPVDSSLVEMFLKGDYCLQGGSGWWKFEFCYGKVVQQYHEDRDGSRYAIVLGEFSLEKHKDWITEHPTKKFKEGKNQVSHFYTGGDYCDAIGKSRTVEVRLKCKESLSQSSVALYLLEPKTCEYVLGVETPLVCSLLRDTDDYGLFVFPQKFSGQKVSERKEDQTEGNTESNEAVESLAEEEHINE